MIRFNPEDVSTYQLSAIFGKLIRLGKLDCIFQVTVEGKMTEYIVNDLEELDKIPDDTNTKNIKICYRIK